MQRQAGVPARRGCASATTASKASSGTAAPGAQGKLQLSLQALPGQGCSGYAGTMNHGSARRTQGSAGGEEQGSAGA